jgi:hypothetical protein
MGNLLRLEWLAIAIAVLVAYAWSGASFKLFFSDTGA